MRSWRSSRATSRRSWRRAASPIANGSPVTSARASPRHKASAVVQLVRARSSISSRSRRAVDRDVVPHHTLEAVRVDLLALDVQRVSAGPCDDRLQSTRRHRAACGDTRSGSAVRWPDCAAGSSPHSTSASLDALTVSPAWSTSIVSSVRGMPRRISTERASTPDPRADLERSEHPELHCWRLQGDLLRVCCARCDACKGWSQHSTLD